MRLPFRFTTQRFRLSLIAAGWSGAILAAVFSAAILLFRKAELDSSLAVLRRASQAATSEFHLNPKEPEWEEVTGPNPDISIAIFAPNGNSIAMLGSLKLIAHVGEGKEKFSQVSAVYCGVRDQQGRVIVVASPWTTKESALRRLAILLLALYFPLVASAGFVTWQASRYTFQPLEELGKQAEKLSATDLSQRLSTGGEDEYAIVSGRLNRFLDLLQASVQTQERFVSDAAHELRTPLTVMRGQIETTLLRSRTPEEYREALHVVLAESERLSRLVEGLLLSSTAPVVAVEPSELCTHLERIQAKWVDRYSQHQVGLELGVCETCQVLIRSEEIESVLDNLLANALAHSPPATKVLIEANAQPGRARIRIADQGPGIPPELQDRLFDRFTRGDAGRNRSSGGFGIGLAVVKRILEARGGTITLIPNENRDTQSEPGIGACFEVTILTA